MTWCFHPSLCQCPVIMGESDDGAKVFNSQITGVQQGNLPPSLPQGKPPSASQPGAQAQALPAEVPLQHSGDSRRGADTLCIDKSVLGIGGSIRKVFSGQAEPGMVPETDVAGGSRHSTSQAEFALPCIPLLIVRGCDTTELTFLVSCCWERG